jgi:antitoxin component YwqK of YwqJK toxin-antitoxin module
MTTDPTKEKEKGDFTSSPLPLNGPIEEITEGKISRVLNYKEGVLEGEARLYEEGFLVQRMIYEKGEFQGPFEVYDKGKILFQCTYDQ